MPTLKVSDTLNFVLPFLGWRSATLGANSEPAITAANTILQTILGPPFRWPWNRAKQIVQVSQGVQDYTQNLTTFGFLEVASIQPAADITATQLTSDVATYTANNSFNVGDSVTVTGTTNGGGVFNVSNAVIVSASATQFTVAITNANVPQAADSGVAAGGKAMEIDNKYEPSTEATEQSRPIFISTQLSDGAGNLTFRLLPVPDQRYQLVLTYQKIPTAIVNTSSLWNIPDYLAYIFNYGMLFMMLDYLDDIRAPRYRQLFIAGLLARAEGLEETRRQLFLANWLPLVEQEQSRQMRAAQGAQARGL